MTTILEERTVATPAFTGSAGASGTQPNPRRAYEMVGSGLYQRYRSVVDADEKAKLGKILRTYEQANLFLVGIEREMMHELFLCPEYDPQEFKDFRLPFKSVVLDLPGERRGLDVMEKNPQLVLVTENGSDSYRVSMIRILNPSSHDLLRVMDVGGLAIRDLAVYSFDFDVDRSTGETTFTQSTDCDLKVTMIGVDKETGELTANLVKSEGAAVAMLIMTIVRCMAYINSPMLYVVKDGLPLTDREARLKAKAVKPFFAKKDIHVVLDHSQVKVLLPAPAGGHHASPVPHSRRAHWRYFKAAKYKKEKTWVRSSDVNVGLRWERGGRTYEVVR